MMDHSGLGGLITQFFIDISNAQTFPILTFFSSAIVNFAVPSGGGHWVVQGPFVMPAAQALGADLGKALGHALVLASDDVDHRQRQQALRRLLQRGVEHLVDLVAEKHRRDRGGADPQDREQKPERKPEPGLQALRQGHARPSR